MGVTSVTGLFNSLQFGNVNSADYGVFITGEAVYNAPERAVEFVDVPGRNGALVLDQGHWSNIEVTYPASISGDSQADFRDAISGFRNAVMAQTGYQRLTDTYNPDEYRLATSAAGFEIKPVFGGRAGEFEIMFNCMPQRWLIAGETPVTISTSGQVLTNPTLHNSSPLIVAEGYGKIGMNGFEPELYDSTVGDVVLADSMTRTKNIKAAEIPTWEFEYNPAHFNAGDTIDVTGLVLTWNAIAPPSTNQITDWASINESGDTSYATYARRIASSPGGVGANIARLILTFNDIQFVAGTSQTIQITYTSPSVGSYVKGHSSRRKTQAWTGVVTVAHDAATGVISVSLQSNLNLQTFNSDAIWFSGQTVQMTVSSIIAHSSLVLVTTPVYIDCEVGEAYQIVGGSAISLNDMISFGSDLPTLAPGDNPITFDNTITSLQITPRWWRL